MQSSSQLTGAAVHSHHAAPPETWWEHVECELARDMNGGWSSVARRGPASSFDASSRQFPQDNDDQFRTKSIPTKIPLKYTRFIVGQKPSPAKSRRNTDGR